MSSSNISQSQIRSLVALADSGSFTKAARDTWTTQSAISQAVSALETNLNVALVRRDRKGVAFTEVGQKVLAHARAVLDHTERMCLEASAAHGLDSGTVYIGSFPSASAKLLPGILASFRRRYPRIETALFEGSEQELTQWIIDRTIDIAFVTEPSPTMRTTVLTTDETVLVLPTAHPLADRSEIAVDEIHDDKFIMSKSSCELSILRIFHAANLEPNTAYEATDLSTRLAMVQAGLGVTMVPRLALPETLDAAAVVRLRPPAPRQISLATHASDTPSLATDAFLREARTWITHHINSSRDTEAAGTVRF